MTLRHSEPVSEYIFVRATRLSKDQVGARFCRQLQKSQAAMETGPCREGHGKSGFHASVVWLTGFFITEVTEGADPRALVVSVTCFCQGNHRHTEAHFRDYLRVTFPAGVMRRTPEPS